MEAFSVLLTQYNSLVTTTPDPSTSAATAGLGFLVIIFVLIFYGILGIFLVFHFISLHNWGTSDSQYFENGLVSKNNWFWVLTFVPFGSIVYFFTTRKTVNAAKKASKQAVQNTPSTNENTNSPLY